MRYSNNKFTALGMALLLSGCVNTASQFSIPNSIAFKGIIFEKVTHSQIDEMQQLLYLPQGSKQDPNKWIQGLLIFLDKNAQSITLVERAALRKKSFAKQVGTIANIDIVGNELQSQIIYPPTERFQDVQLEVSRGRDFTCGYGQMQFSDKRIISGNKLPNLKEYQAELQQLAKAFSHLSWQIGCR